MRRQPRFLAIPFSIVRREISSPMFGSLDGLTTASSSSR
jgi:hypothetical protein